MMESYSLVIHIFANDDFRKNIRKYYGKGAHEEITDEEIVEYVNLHVQEARSTDPSFQIEGGDTDGWFIQGMSHDW